MDLLTALCTLLRHGCTLVSVDGDLTPIFPNVSSYNACRKALDAIYAHKGELGRLLGKPSSAASELTEGDRRRFRRCAPLTKDDGGMTLEQLNSVGKWWAAKVERRE